MIKVAVCGALGRMGQEVVNAINEADGMELSIAIDWAAAGQKIGDIEVEKDLETALKSKQADVIVDFTQPDSVFKNALIAINAGVSPVIGTTGLSDKQLAELKEITEAKELGCLIAPNFTIGAVLMMKFSQMAAKYFHNAEIIEFHHNQKKDAPSGTAIKTAQMMSKIQEDFAKNNCAEVELIEGSRGGKSDSNIQIHSVRMPGYMASQEVSFGSSGETLKIRHDSIDRKCYMSGVVLAIRYIFKNNDFIYGLENIL
ncbi:MAG: 4-hydroxy-tetrahydrodipicolinate reductase [bacterium]